MLLIAASIVGICNCAMYCCALLCVFCNHLDGEERAGCFYLFVFLMSYNCCYYVALPHGAVSWSAVFDCGIIR